MTVAAPKPKATATSGGRLNRECYAAGVAAHVDGRPREAPTLARRSLEDSWLAGWDSVSERDREAEAAKARAKPKRAPEPAPDASVAWPKDKPHPSYYKLRAPLPCRFCGLVLQADASQAVVTTQVWGNVVGLLSRCCGKRWKLPAKEDTA